jgi:hypothetical protein
LELVPGAKIQLERMACAQQSALLINIGLMIWWKFMGPPAYHLLQDAPTKPINTSIGAGFEA